MLRFSLTHSSTSRILGIAPRNSTVEGYYLTVGIHKSSVLPWYSTVKEDKSTVKGLRFNSRSPKFNNKKPKFNSRDTQFTSPLLVFSNKKNQQETFQVYKTGFWC